MTDDYLRNKILTKLVSLEALIGQPSPAIERLIKKTHDDAVRAYLELNTDPRHLRSRFQHVRKLIAAGEVAKAADQMDRIEHTRRHIEGLLLKAKLLKIRRQEGRKKGTAKVATASQWQRIDALIAEGMTVRDAIRQAAIEGGLIDQLALKHRVDDLLSLYAKRKLLA